ncbi:MAG: hypothetical protein CMA72_09125 [Euryarchaeota archaeon]|nr:hypothetical protein [Euryarchaeota archaeon]|tara:strand:+ start:2370 stop:2567 length:198 start_codon:yes stop_codon:yes gene_type:complete
MKIGDLVKKKKTALYSVTKIGVVIATNPRSRRDGTLECSTVRVRWADAYGSFWTTFDSLDMVSEA